MCTCYALFYFVLFFFFFFKQKTAYEMRISDWSSDVCSSNVADYMVWYAKRRQTLKYRDLFTATQAGEAGATKYREIASIRALKNTALNWTRLTKSDDLKSQGGSSSEQRDQFAVRAWKPPNAMAWQTKVEGERKHTS